MFFLLNFQIYVAKLVIFPRYSKKKEEKFTKKEIFHYSLFTFFLYLCTRFFRKHIENSCDGELSINVLLTT